MRLTDAVRLAVSALRGSMMRTLLTILGLAVGVGAVLTVQTLGNAGEVRVEGEIAKLGVNKVWIRPKEAGYSLVAGDAQRLYEASGAPACASTYSAVQTFLDGGPALLQAAGFDQQFAAVYGPKLLQGRMFTDAEFQQGSAVCIVDEALAERLGSDALGQRVQAGHRRLRVVGVIKGLTTQTMAAGSGLIVMPLSTFEDTIGGEVAEITLTVQPDQDTKIVADAALAALALKSAYRADTLEKEINAAREVVRIFVMVLLCVAAVCMLTGGIGVMNVLLLSVRERRREIGLIKAIGGTSGQVCVLFLLEAAAYAALGGVLGLLLGAGMIRLFGAWIGLDASLRIGTALPVLAAGAILGVAFGVAPAVKAARLEPVEALQCE